MHGAGHYLLLSSICYGEDSGDSSSSTGSHSTHHSGGNSDSAGINLNASSLHSTATSAQGVNANKDHHDHDTPKAELQLQRRKEEDWQRWERYHASEEPGRCLLIFFVLLFVSVAVSGSGFEREKHGRALKANPGPSQR